ncbi:MAG: aldehyde dehydrogenase family protein [Pseudomonadota bacterium]
MQDKRQLYINGAWVDPIDGKDLAVIDPSTEETIATISLGGVADTDAAVAAAKGAFPAFSMTSKEERLSYLKSLFEIYSARSDEMGEVISEEMGAPISMAKMLQAGAGAGHLKAFIRALEVFEFDRPLRENAPNDRLLYEPVGVCGLITPWNWPMNQVMLKVAPALATGSSASSKV